MEPSKPLGTFQELAERDLEIRVVCQRCGHEAVLDGDAPKLRNRRLAGQRFRCKRCNGIGLPAIDKAGVNAARLWPSRLAKHARKLSE